MYITIILTPFFWYKHGIVKYITKGVTGGTEDESRRLIEPLVLWTQLDSEDSDSDDDEEQNNDERMSVYKETSAYDEDVDGAKAEETFEEKKVKNEGNLGTVSKN